MHLTRRAVNGIRNPFQYQPWRGKKTFAAMFDILEADIVVFQETKIQKKDLRDDMILVEGWDSYWSLPRYKKGRGRTSGMLNGALMALRVFRGGYLHQTIGLRPNPC